ncbi:MAG: hypothetical protein EA412_00665, partial [Chitinophagaceae bacterium]
MHGYRYPDHEQRLGALAPGVFEFLFFPNGFDWYSYYKYFAGSFLFLSWLVVYYRKLDSKILNFYYSFSEKKKKVLRILSLFYYFGSIIFFYWVSDLLKGIR